MMDEAVNIRYILTNLLINQYILKHNLEPASYTFDMFVSDYLKRERIAVDTNIPAIEEEFFLGVTVKKKNKIKIFINPRISKNRFNFSMCHEVSHCHYDVSKTEISQTFFNMDENPTYYNENELFIEELANLAAGIIMLPDITLLKKLHTKKSFHTIAEEAKMSRAALWKRMVNFGQIKCDMNEGLAHDSATRFQTMGNREVYHKFMSTWGSNIENQIIMDFENSL
ncbi:ImmA/IrrE family metallo-endopeptidase [Enterococcus sp. BWT-B8]|uniref:ImmA/IrrE family metallo-endopeptidase n=1 Tax=Enterococcus sp. BWT-B8 TaxID=2885157 RepID=UPI001E5272CD|nr:ImmA/IrrE family metallo-endopeptidase [Enterococcus sp. BWT-B8]MCB5951841.1 ImmA/IrrE family metallo-endopeptidase [Enterococcus sp. BWT-B8]